MMENGKPRKRRQLGTPARTASGSTKRWMARIWVSAMRRLGGQHRRHRRWIIEAVARRSGVVATFDAAAV